MAVVREEHLRATEVQALRELLPTLTEEKIHHLQKGRIQTKTMNLNSIT
jgi:hypothetical protein